MCTRWGSKADMIERITEQQDAIRVVLGQDRKVSHLIPSWQDFDVLQSVLEAVRGFKDSTDLLSDEKRVTCSAIKPPIEVVNDKIVTPKDDDTELTLEIKQCIKNDLESRYQNPEMNFLLDKCAFLDPRFKNRFTKVDDAVMTLMDEIERPDEIERLSEIERASGVEQLPDNDLLPPRKIYCSIWYQITSSSRANTCDVSIADQVKNKVDMYLQYLSFNIDESPLKWWKLECSRLPMLSVAAQKYLCVCATSVTSERVFSIVAGQLVTSRHSRLNPDKVNN